jgi:alkyl hydroperoxide reductase subunit AhpC
VKLQNNYKSFQDAGVEIVALAVAPVSVVNDGLRRVVGASFPMLGDPNHQVAEAYGVYNLMGDQKAAPSVFVIDADGRIVWRYIGKGPGDRPSVGQILEHLP